MFERSTEGRVSKTAEGVVRLIKQFRKITDLIAPHGGMRETGRGISVNNKDYRLCSFKCDTIAHDALL